MFSMSDRSGECTDKGSNRKPGVSKNVRIRVTCGIVLSCWMMAFVKPRRKGTTNGRKMSEIYCSALKLPFIGTTDVHIVCPKAPQIMYTIYRKPMPISNASKRGVFFSELPDTYTAIRIQHAEPELVGKDDIVLFSVSNFVIGHTRFAVSL